MIWNITIQQVPQTCWFLHIEHCHQPQNASCTLSFKILVPFPPPQWTALRKFTLSPTVLYSFTMMCSIIFKLSSFENFASFWTLSKWQQNICVLCNLLFLFNNVLWGCIHASVYSYSNFSVVLILVYDYSTSCSFIFLIYVYLVC